ncbi:MAG: hypothetical protein JW940_03345 [Polyangiaceae bacterium]|nr:hypothetical protein [Polyangiaceae bacterium]
MAIWCGRGHKATKCVVAATYPAAAMPRVLANTRPEADEALDGDALDDPVQPGDKAT